jgi:hypothetical protein
VNQQEGLEREGGRWSGLWWTPLTPRKQNARFRNGTPLSVVFYVTANFGWYFPDVVIFEWYETNFPKKVTLS